METDDRGNCVNFVIDGELYGVLDREADPIDGIDSEFTYSWDGNNALMLTVFTEYQVEIEFAVLCDVLRTGDLKGDAKANLLDYISIKHI